MFIFVLFVSLSHDTNILNELELYQSIFWIYALISHLDNHWGNMKELSVIFNLVL